jgi:maltooligosyltrehalose synthase
MEAMNMNSKLYDKADIEAMSATTQKLDALLKADGYSLIEAGRMDGMEINHFTTINRLEYMREDWEKVFIVTHEKSTGGKHGI